jgi:hypothetical protein
MTELGDDGGVEGADLWGRKWGFGLEGWERGVLRLR